MVSVIGGTAMSGGVGSIVGTFLGTFIIAEVRTGLVIALAVIINVRLTSAKK